MVEPQDVFHRPALQNNVAQDPHEQEEDENTPDYNPVV